MKNCSGGLSSTQNWIPAFAGMTEQGIFLKTTHKIITWFAGVFLLVTVGVVVSFWTFKQVEESTKIRDHTYAVLNGAVDFMSALKDAESGQRGYLLTGDEAYLAHYSRERDSITADLAKLRQLTLLPTAQQHLDALVPLVAAKLVHMSEIIALRRERDMAGVAAEMRTGQGLQLMDAIRAEMTGFIRLEEALLLQHEADFQSNMRLMFTLIVSTSMLALLFAVFFRLFDLSGNAAATQKSGAYRNWPFAGSAGSVEREIAAGQHHFAGERGQARGDAQFHRRCGHRHRR